MQFKVRDKRRKERFFIDDEYLNGAAKLVGIFGTGVYMALCRYANQEQSCFPSQERMAGQLNIGLASVKRGLKSLEDYNIISTKRIGKGRNNEYWLLDHTEWRIKVIAPTEPSGEFPQSHHPVLTEPLRLPNKDTYNKEIVETQGVSGKEINDLIELFKSVNPTYERLFPNKNQRASLERLVKKFGREQVESMIKFLPKIFGKLYAPRITTPYALEKKIADLIAYVQSEKEKGGKVFTIKPIQK